MNVRGVQGSQCGVGSGRRGSDEESPCLRHRRNTKDVLEGHKHSWAPTRVGRPSGRTYISPKRLTVGLLLRLQRPRLTLPRSHCRSDGVPKRAGGGAGGGVTDGSHDLHPHPRHPRKFTSSTSPWGCRRRKGGFCWSGRYYFYLEGRTVGLNPESEWGRSRSTTKRVTLFFPYSFVLQSHE